MNKSHSQVETQSESAQTSIVSDPSGTASVTEAGAQTRQKKVESKNYWKEIGLIIVGATIGIAPATFMMQLQAKVQLKQFILDRQINTLKDYSTSYNQLGGNILGELQGTIVKLQLAQANGTLSDKELDEIILSLAKKMTDVQNFAGSLNTQRTMVYALFGDEPPAANIPSYGESTADDFKKRLPGDVTESNLVRALIDTASTTEKTIVESMKRENDGIQKLASRVRQQYKD